MVLMDALINTRQRKQCSDQNKINWTKADHHTCMHQGFTSINTHSWFEHYACRGFSLSRQIKNSYPYNKLFNNVSYKCEPSLQTVVHLDP